MTTVIAIGLGGAIGSVFRFWTASLIYDLLGRSFPLGTLFVNVSGCFLMGLLAELMVNRYPVASEIRAAILVGFLGGYTTFSTFALETFSLIEDGGYAKAVINGLLSMLFCIGAVWFGVLIVRLAGRGDVTGSIFPQLILPAVLLLGFLVLHGGLVAYAIKSEMMTTPVAGFALIIGLSMCCLIAVRRVLEFSSSMEALTLLGLFLLSVLLGTLAVASGYWLEELWIEKNQ
jgi:CrcB protein